LNIKTLNVITLSFIYLHYLKTIWLLMIRENDLIKLQFSPTLSGVLWCSLTLSKELWSFLPESSKREGHQAGRLSERRLSIITSKNKNKTKITPK
jgi:hypothetical protein